MSPSVMLNIAMGSFTATLTFLLQFKLQSDRDIPPIAKEDFTKYFLNE